MLACKYREVVEAMVEQRIKVATAQQLRDQALQEFEAAEKTLRYAQDVQEEMRTRADALADRITTLEAKSGAQ